MSLPISRFKMQGVEKYSCHSCMNICQSLFQCSKCLKYICKLCIDASNQTRKKLTHPSVVADDFALKKLKVCLCKNPSLNKITKDLRQMLENLEVCCENVDHGCREVISWKKVSKHEAKCLYSMVKKKKALNNKATNDRSHAYGELNSTFIETPDIHLKDLSSIDGPEQPSMKEEDTALDLSCSFAPLIKKQETKSKSSLIDIKASNKEAYKKNSSKLGLLIKSNVIEKESTVAEGADKQDFFNIRVIKPEVENEVETPRLNNDQPESEIALNLQSQNNIIQPSLYYEAFQSNSETKEQQNLIHRLLNQQNAAAIDLNRVEELGNIQHQSSLQSEIIPIYIQTLQEILIHQQYQINQQNQLAALQGTFNNNELSPGPRANEVYPNTPSFSKDFSLSDVILANEKLEEVNKAQLAKEEEAKKLTFETVVDIPALESSNKAIDDIDLQYIERTISKALSNQTGSTTSERNRLYSDSSNKSKVNTSIIHAKEHKPSNFAYSSPPSKMFIQLQKKQSTENNGGFGQFLAQRQLEEEKIIQYSGAKRQSVSESVYSIQSKDNSTINLMRDVSLASFAKLQKLKGQLEGHAKIQELVNRKIASGMLYQELMDDRTSVRNGTESNSISPAANSNRRFTIQPFLAKKLKYLKHGISNASELDISPSSRILDRMPTGNLLKLSATVTDSSGSISWNASINSNIVTDSKTMMALSKVLPEMTSCHTLYRMTADGSSNEKFHARCDGRSVTLSIIELNDGVILAAFTTIPWSSCQLGQYVADTQSGDLQSFIIILNDKLNRATLKLPLKPGKSHRAVFHERSKGLVFGDGHDIEIDFDCHIDSSLNLGSAYHCPSNLLGDGLTLGPIWCVNDVEVFELII